MLVIHESCQEHFQRVKQFAEQIGLAAKLQENLDHLAGYGGMKDGANGKVEFDTTVTQCTLYKDFAPHSFEFVIAAKDERGHYTKRWFNGGLIFHGAGSSGVEFPVLSVRTGDTSKAGWSIHT